MCPEALESPTKNQGNKAQSDWISIKQKVGFKI